MINDFFVTHHHFYTFVAHLKDRVFNSKVAKSSCMLTITESRQNRLW